MVALSPVVGEFVGTFVLIVLGNGVVAGALLNRSKAQNAGWISITAGWAVAVFAGVAVSAALSDLRTAPRSRQYGAVRLKTRRAVWS